jgi:pyrimidine operon attenuation protein/uracil phosphoribosyltransferase
MTNSLAPLMSKEEMRETLENLAEQVAERHPGCAGLVLVGIQRRGADLARRLRALMQTICGHEPPIADLDINFYRDDWTSSTHMPVLGSSHIPVDLTGKTVLLVDDVLFTGRTIRAALEALLDFGRPSRVELLVLIDRGHRELPIHADFIGRVIRTERHEHIDVCLAERDTADGVSLIQRS